MRNQYTFVTNIILYSNIFENTNSILIQTYANIVTSCSYCYAKDLCAITNCRLYILFFKIFKNKN